MTDVHVHVANYEQEAQRQAAEEATETAAAETATKTEDSHVHVGIAWPHLGGWKTAKEDEVVMEGSETVEARPAPADESQLSADDDDAWTPKSRKLLLLGNDIFSPRRGDLQKSLSTDATDERDGGGAGVIAYSVEGDGQIVAADESTRRSTQPSRRRPAPTSLSRWQ